MTLSKFVSALSPVLALLIEDCPEDAAFLQDSLEDIDCPIEIRWVPQLSPALALLETEQYDIVLLDLSLPDSQSLDALHKIKLQFPHTPVVILTGLDDQAIAMEALKYGAQDYLVKGKPSGESIYRCLRYAIERNRADELIRESLLEAKKAQSKLELALNASETGVWQWEVRSDVHYWDARVNAIFDVDPNTTDRHVLQSRIHSEDLPKVDQTLEACLRGQEEYNVEFRVLWRDGSTHHLACRGKVFFDSEGAPMQHTGVVRDVTKKVEQHEKEKRLALLEQREEFVAMLAHDLKSPIYGAQRILSFLNRGYLGELQPRQIEVLTKISASNQWILHTINNLLDVYKIEAGVDPLILDQDLHAIIAACVEEMEPIALASNIKLSYTCNLQRRIMADEVGLMRVICNLVSNALKFTPDHGSVTIQCSERDERAVIRVTDTGCGMTEQDIANIFKRFYQTNKTHRGKGLGLGLYLCRQLLEAQKGTLQCTSVPGKGSTLEISLPLAKVERPPRVLVVDDAEICQFVLQKHLAHLSIEADIVASGSEAVEAVKETGYDAIFLDLMMPIMDGVTTSKALRQVGVNVPVFAYSAHPMLEDPNGIEASIFDDYLPKPINTSRLKDLIHKWFGDNAKFPKTPGVLYDD